MRTEYEEPLYKPDGSVKPGCNKIVYDDNDIMISKEYLPGGKPLEIGAALAAVMTATPEELAQIKAILGI